jgi:L-arabinose isomerase
MASGLGGASFMEDYTYHLQAGNKMVLGSHMLEICPSIADGKASLEVHPLGIGGKADPARLVFNAPAGAGLNAAMMDFGNRFRLLINEVDCITPPEDMPKLPVARAVWKCRPCFDTACAAWIYAGGAHHTGFSQVVTTEMMEDFGAIAGLEVVVIDADTKLRQFKQELVWNDAAYGLKSGWVS